MTDIKRHDTFTPPLKIDERYSDFDARFEPHPASGDLIRITNETSVKTSVKNLVLTKVAEKFFKPNVGTKVYNTLFEPIGRFAAEDIEYYTKKVLTDYESKRIKLVSVTATVSKDQSGYDLTIVFVLLSTGNTLTINTVLKRDR